jgi:hypothetical protein
MEGPTIRLGAPVRLRRTCERNRLQEQFLIAAYEYLVAIIERDERHIAAEFQSAKSTTRRKAIATCGAHCC